MNVKDFFARLNASPNPQGTLTDVISECGLFEHLTHPDFREDVEAVIGQITVSIDEADKDTLIRAAGRFPMYGNWFGSDPESIRKMLRTRFHVVRICKENSGVLIVPFSHEGRCLCGVKFGMYPHQFEPMICFDCEDGLQDWLQQKDSQRNRLERDMLPILEPGLYESNLENETLSSLHELCDERYCTLCEEFEWAEEITSSISQFLTERSIPFAMDSVNGMITINLLE